MRIQYLKKTGESTTKTIQVLIGITKTGDLLPYLTVSALYSLIAYNSVPISESHFRKTYNDFVKDPQNAHLRVEEQLSFGRGGHKKVILNTEGLRKFAQTNNHKFQFCVTSMKNFIDACMSEFERIESSQNSSKIFQDRTLPSSSDVLPINPLYNWLISVDVYIAQSSIFFELQRVLDSTNTFYIMELAGNRFRAGQSRDSFRTWLRQHPAYNSENFVKFYGIYLFTDSPLADCVTMENDFFLKAAEILKIDKSQVSRCKLENDSSFVVDSGQQIQHMLELCLVNSRIQYDGLIEPITDINVLNFLNNKNW